MIDNAHHSNLLSNLVKKPKNSNDAFNIWSYLPKLKKSFAERKYLSIQKLVIFEVESTWQTVIFESHFKYETDNQSLLVQQNSFNF